MKASRLVLIGVAAGGALAVGAVVLHRRRLAGGGGPAPERAERAERAGQAGQAGQAEPSQPERPVRPVQTAQQAQPVLKAERAEPARQPQPPLAPEDTPVERLAAELDMDPISPPRKRKATRSTKVKRASAVVLTGGVVAAAAVSGVVAFGDSGADSATDPAPAPQTVNVAAAQTEIRNVTAKAAPGTRTATAMCPPGFSVISGGGFATGVRGHSAPTAAIPFHGSGGDGFTVTWGGGTAGADENAAATCAKGLSDVGIVSKTGPSGPPSKRQVWAPCPVGTRVVGFGGKVTSAGGSALSGLGPVKRGKGGFVQAPDASQVTAYAVCAKAPAKWQVRTWTSASRSTASKDYKLLCPADTRRLGSGFTTFQQKTSLVNAFGAGAPDGVTGARTAAGPKGNGPWRLRVTAVCAR
ncbi:hypothetical protein J4573_09835 [Actinomadura barringtoniae]|uniref:Uncharacterized protein n=1 Tax=Actinomadura barringtoniae TaxID=1427535 RepID=A0A939T8X6_9ACTN|nr:hypothetical protein [Actinomadura barringtoniae]MBO2447385.1 hypothetical protein [Actinomadura barringtoniae]